MMKKRKRAAQWCLYALLLAVLFMVSVIEVRAEDAAAPAVITTLEDGMTTKSDKLTLKQSHE
ncbi:MAG: hypothetical protein ACK5MN_10865 [Lachnospiraceae bacterium]